MGDLEQQSDLQPGLVGDLEPDQLVHETSRPLPRARLSPEMQRALWALRVFVVVLGAMVLYTFVSQLGH